MIWFLGQSLHSISSKNIVSTAVYDKIIAHFKNSKAFKNSLQILVWT